MLGNAASSSEASFEGNDNSLAGEEDPDDILTGGGSIKRGSGGGGGGVRGGGGERVYSALLPHLLDLVAYQSGVEASEVSAYRTRVVPADVFFFLLY